MSVVAVAILLGVALLLMIRSGQVKPGPAAACVLFGLILGLTPVGPVVNDGLTAIGEWIWSIIQSW